MNQLVDWYLKGGFMMHPILLCSLIAVAVSIERLVRLRRSLLIDPKVVEEIQTQIEQGQYARALELGRTSPTLAARILAKALDDFVNTPVTIETALSEVSERELPVLSNNLSILSLIARVATLLGLQGTVLGMIMGFERLCQAGVGKEQLAEAIYVALITTAAGLFVAIPTVVAYGYFRSRIRRIQAEFDEIFTAIVKTVRISPQPPTKTRTACDARPITGGSQDNAKEPA